MKKILVCLLLFLTAFLFAESVDENLLDTFMQNGMYIKYCLSDDIIYINKASILYVKSADNKLFVVSNGGSYTFTPFVTQNLSIDNGI